jgi:HSP20 family molecular chaperone IbpA
MSSNLDRFLQRSAQLREEIETLQRKGTNIPGDSGGKTWHPRFELYHYQDHLFIDIELPGVPETAVEVEPHPDLVIVRGHKPTLEDLPDREQIVSSREYGPFASQFAMPPGYVLDALDQRLENGVLHLKVRIALRHAASDAR